MDSCLLNNTKIRGTDPYAVKSAYNICLPQNLVVSGICWVLVPGPLAQKPKSEDAQILYIKWHRSVHTIFLIHGLPTADWNSAGIY